MSRITEHSADGDGDIRIYNDGKELTEDSDAAVFGKDLGKNLGHLLQSTTRETVFYFGQAGTTEAQKLQDLAGGLSGKEVCDRDGWESQAGGSKACGVSLPHRIAKTPSV